MILRVPASQARVNYLVEHNWLRCEDIGDPVRVADAVDRMLADSEATAK
jgi:hypothetical protein